jgi:hypothetical protein
MSDLVLFIFIILFQVAFNKVRSLYQYQDTDISVLRSSLKHND